MPLLRLRGPADRGDDGVLFGAPGMPDAGPPHDVVAGVLKDDWPRVKVDPEAASDEKDDGSAVLGIYSLGTLLATSVDAPLDLDVVALAQVTLGKEVPDEPAPPVSPAGGGVAGVEPGWQRACVHRLTSIPGGRARAGALLAKSRSPSMKAKSPSSLQRGSLSRRVRPSVSRDE